MKKHFIIMLILYMLLILTSCVSSKDKVVGEYDINTLQGDFLKTDYEAYEIGANRDGQPIFKDNDKAFNQALIDYKKGFLEIQKEYNLETINKENYKDYKVNGSQLYTDDKSVLQEGIEISKFLDIYENSFK